MAPQATPINKYRNTGLGTQRSTTGRKQAHPDTIAMALALQTTLNLEELLQTFLAEARNYLVIDGLSYRSNSPANRIQLDHPSHHTCSYNLELHGSQLGEIVFSRRHRFHESEMEALEYMLSSAIYPLRNAIEYQRAVEMAQFDALTGVHNRHSFDGVVNQEMCRSRRHGAPLTMMVIDLDHFKNINDTYGHHNGDLVLKATAKRICDALRTSDHLFRFGGEEFVVLLTDTEMEDADVVAERIHKNISSATVAGSEGPISVTASIGVTQFDREDTQYTLFDRADKALYTAKREGRNMVVQSVEL